MVENCSLLKRCLGPLLFVGNQGIALISDCINRKPNYILSGRAREIVAYIIDNISLFLLNNSHAMRRKRKALERGSVRKILIIRIDRLGDLILTSPVIANLKAAFPDAEIWAVLSPVGASLLKHDPRLSKVLPYHTWRYAAMGGGDNLSQRIGIFDLLYKQDFDLILHLRTTLGFLILGVLSKAISIARAINVTNLHSVQKTLVCLKAIGIPVNKSELSIFLGKEDFLFAQETFSKAGVLESDFVIGIHPGAGNESRRWDVCNFGRVVKELKQMSDRNIRFVIFGGPSDTGRANAIIKISGVSDTISLAGKTTVSQMGALIKKCDLFIGQDTGPTHMASAFKVPIVVIWGNESLESVHPWTHSDLSVVIMHPVDCRPCMYFECAKDYDCIRSISPEQVVQAVVKQISFLDSKT
jgi:heptosyltransferase II